MYVVSKKAVCGGRGAGEHMCDVKEVQQCVDAVGGRWVGGGWVSPTLPGAIWSPQEWPQEGGKPLGGLDECVCLRGVLWEYCPPRAQGCIALGRQ